MLTQLVACYLTIVAAVASSEDNATNAALRWQPVTWFVVSLSATLLMLLVTVTCARRRERAGGKGLLGVDLVERGVLHGEQSGGLCEWLSRRWPWSQAPRRTPQLSCLRMGLSRSTQPLLCYQLVEKRHVHLTRAALCVVRTDLKELQELTEEESLTKTSRGSTDSSGMAQMINYYSEHGPRTGSPTPTERLGSLVGNPIVQLGMVKPVESSSQALFHTVKPLGPSTQHVTWSQSTQNVTSGAEFLGEGGVGEPLPEVIPIDSVVITGDSTQSQNQISDNFALDVKHMEKLGTAGEATKLSETADTGGSDESQPPIIITEEITQASDHVTPSKNVIKARSYIDLHGKESNKSEPTISHGSIQGKRDLLSVHKMQSSTDLEQSSQSDVLGEISGSSDDFPTFLQLHKQSQEQDFMLEDNVGLKREIKTRGYISSPNGDPESSLSKEEVRIAIDNTITQSPSVYMSVLDEDALKLPKHTLSKEEIEDSDVSANVSSCFLHAVVPQSQQECFQFNEHNSSKTVQYISLPPEKENSAQHLQYWQETEYKVASASVITNNNIVFNARKIPTKRQSPKGSENNIAAEEVPELPTSWDLLHSFPCHNDTGKMLRMDTTCRMNTVSDSYSEFKQHEEHFLYQRRKEDDVLTTKQQKSCNTDSRPKGSREDQHSSTVGQPPSSFRPAYTPVSYSEATTEQQHCPLTTTTNMGEHRRVLQWRITVSPHLASSNKRQTKTPDQRPNEL